MEGDGKKEEAVRKDTSVLPDILILYAIIPLMAADVLKLKVLLKTLQLTPL